MRISGSPASASLKTTSETVKETYKTEESKGIVGGNDSTELTLSSTPEEGSLKVYAGGTLLTRGYEQKGTTLTIQKNACNAGALITANYKTKRTLDKEEYLLVKSGSITLSETPKAETIVVKKDGALLQLTTDYTVSGKTINIVKDGIVEDSGSITLSETPKAETIVVKKDGALLQLTTDYTVSGKTINIVKDGIVEDDEIQVNYKYVSGTVENVTENSNNGVNFVTKYTKKTVTLTKTPVKGSIRIYIANTEASNSLAYEIQEPKTIVIDKKYFNKLDEIMISYLYEDDKQITSELIIETKYGGEIYNQAKVTVKTVNNEEEGYYE